MSEVRIRWARRGWVRVSGGKVGRLKSFRGIWAVCAEERWTGDCEVRAWVDDWRWVVG